MQQVTMRMRSVLGFTPLLLLIFILPFTSVCAQQVEFKASAREQVAVGDQFRLIYSVNAQANGFKAPSIKDFSILTGPQQSTSSSMQIINNQVTRSVEYSYTFVLQAVKEGNFTIPAASVVVDGQTYQSNPVNITVVKGNANQQAPIEQGNQSPAAEISSKNLFVKATVNNNNPYQGEQVIVTYRIYTRVPVSQYSVSKTPALTGFWTENLLKENTPLNQYKEIINGAEYVVAEIKKDALFSQKSGKLIIDPLELEVVAQLEIKRRRSNDPFDDFFNNSFFGSNYQNVKKKILSNPITLNVKPLPASQAGKDFTGAVGKFTISSSVDKNTVKENDALTLKFTVSGSGNLKLIDKPAFTFPPDFDVYDPRIIDDITTNTSGISGKRTFEYLLVPRNRGNYVIKPVAFVYFDPGSGSYKSLKTPEYKITVEKGDGKDTYVKGNTDKEDFQYIGTDIRYIYTGSINLKPVNQYFFQSALFWILFALPVVLFALFIIIWKKELKKRSNVALMRNKKATRIAKKRLKAAEQYLMKGNQSSFCTEVSSALWGYISDKFNISRSALSIDSVAEALRKKNVREELIAKFLDTLNHCEYARFAPGDKSEVMSNLYSEALEVITQTEQELK
jgi:hypothetical protein